MDLYTRTGDDGTTGLFGAGRVGKDAPRVEAYGGVDEANAHIGSAVVACAADERFAEVGEMLRSLQSRLFDLGADLATPPGSPGSDKITRMTNAHAAELEGWIDRMDEGNEPLRAFVLPGGTEVAARLHLARTAVRRAERRTVALSRCDGVGTPVIVFLNRASDLLFAMARRANNAAGVPDVPWTPSRGED